MTGKWYDCNDGRRYVVETRRVGNVPYGVLVDLQDQTVGPELTLMSIGSTLPYSDITPGTGPVPSEAKALAEVADVPTAEVA